MNLKSLTPTINAENGDFYCSVLKAAIDNDLHNNIAITGGYGSGKSSVIETFLGKHPEYKPIRISLASFNFDDSDGKEGVQSRRRRSKVFGFNSDNTNEQIELEISLLQQFLYQSDNWEKEKSEFPLDRISIEWRIIISIICLFGMLVSIKTFWNTTDLYEWFKISSDQHIMYATLIVLVCSILFLFSSGWFMYFFFKLFKKVKTAKIDIKPVSVEVSEGERISLLNAYLFEIVKLFKNSDRNIVILEDIDRLDSHGLFEKLREISNILKLNPDTKPKKIKFVYSLKESIFQTEKEKNKFFDIIIPVVPYINHLNSKDKLSTFIKEIETDFNSKLKEVIQIASLCIDDMRTISNISNEYFVYKRVTGSKDLEPEKLLALIVYKNIFPSDFEKIHSGNSELQKIFDRRSDLVKKMRDEISNRISGFEDQIELIKEEEKSSIPELRSQYIMEFMKKLETGDQLLLQGNQVAPADLINDENFELIRRHGMETINGYSFSFTDIEQLVSSSNNYVRRLELVKDKSGKALDLMKMSRDSLKSELARVDTMPFSKLIKGEEVFEGVEFLFEKEKLHSNKFKYNFIEVMLSKQYIAPDYKYWISLMHEGSLSETDREFIFSIKNNTPFEFDRKLDDVSAVTNELFPDDWSSLAILNFELFNYNYKHIEFRNKLIPIYDQFKLNPKEGFEFIDKYFDVCTSKKVFIEQMMSFWDGFVKNAIQLEFNFDKLLPSIFMYVDINVLNEQNLENGLSNYVDNQADFIELFKNEKPSKASIQKVKTALNNLDVKLERFKADEKNQLFDVIYEAKAYVMNLENIKTVQRVLSPDLESSLSITNITKSRFLHLKSYVNSDLNVFIEKVLVPNYEEVDEWIETREIIIMLLNNKEIAEENKVNILRYVDIEVLDLDEITNVTIWSYIIEYAWINAKWKNVLDYYNHFGLDEKLLDVLNDNTWVRNLELSEDSGIEHNEVESFIGEVLKCDIGRVPLESLLVKYRYYIPASLITSDVKAVNIGVIIDINYFQFDLTIFNAIKELHSKDNLHLHYAQTFQGEFNQLSDSSYFLLGKQEFIYVLKETRFESVFLWKVLIVNAHLVKELSSEEGVLVLNAIKKCDDYSSFDLLYETMKILESKNQISFFNSITESNQSLSVEESKQLLTVFNTELTGLMWPLRKFTLFNSVENQKFCTRLKSLDLINKYKSDDKSNVLSFKRNSNT